MRILATSLALAAVWLGGCSRAPQKAPDTYRVKFETTKGDFLVDVIRTWSPLGADRFYELVTTGFFDQARFFRIVPGFVVQFGLKGDPAVDAKWFNARLADDPPAMPNTPATICFATSGPNSRTTQVFINLGDNRRLDSQGFTPFGRVTEGMSVVTALYSEYGEAPDQNRIRLEGNRYLEAQFPKLDYIRKASILP